MKIQSRLGVTIPEKDTIYYNVRGNASDLFTSVSATERVVKLSVANGSSGFSFDNGTDLITIVDAGTYIVTYDLFYAHNAASYGICYLKVNGVQDNQTIKRINGTIYNSISQTSLITTVGANTTLGLYTWVTTGSINDQNDSAAITILKVS